MRFIFFSCFLFISWQTLEKQLSPLPNIVLLIGDDHGWPYFGFMGADYASHCRQQAGEYTGKLLSWKKEKDEQWARELEKENLDTNKVGNEKKNVH